MMGLEKICVSLETAKKLAEAGIEIESEFGWVMYKWGECKLVVSKKHCSFQDQVEGYYPAPTSDELYLYLYKTTQVEQLADMAISERRLIDGVI